MRGSSNLTVITILADKIDVVFSGEPHLVSDNQPSRYQNIAFEPRNGDCIFSDLSPDISTTGIWFKLQDFFIVDNFSNSSTRGLTSGFLHGLAQQFLVENFQVSAVAFMRQIMV